MELADAPLAASILAPDGRELARSTGDGRWTPTTPTADEVAAVAAAASTGVTASPAPKARIASAACSRRCAMHPATCSALLFVELRLPLPWRHLLVDSSFESPTVFGFLVVFGIASSIFLAWWVTRRLNRVARAATAWSRGDFSDRIDDRSRDELGGLSVAARSHGARSSRRSCARARSSRRSPSASASRATCTTRSSRRRLR